MKSVLVAVLIALCLVACGRRELTARERIEELEFRVDMLEECLQEQCREAWKAQATPEYWKAKAAQR